MTGMLDTVHQHQLKGSPLAGSFPRLSLFTVFPYSTLCNTTQHHLLVCSINSCPQDFRLLENASFWHFIKVFTDIFILATRLWVWTESPPTFHLNLLFASFHPIGCLVAANWMKAGLKKKERERKKKALFEIQTKLKSWTKTQFKINKDDFVCGWWSCKATQATKGPL